MQLKNILASAVLASFALIGQAQAMDVAITVDDLPYFGTYESSSLDNRMQIAKTMLAAFKKHHITGVYGFVIGAKANDEISKKILKLWVQSGQLLGNHTYSHMNLANHSSNEYIADIKKTNLILAQYMESANYRYFRYPYLSEGDSIEKRNAVRKYLLDNNYQIAETTLDFWDYEWNEPYSRCLKQQNKEAIEYLQNSYLTASVGTISTAHDLSQFLFKRQIKQIMLLHIGALDALMLDQVLTNYERRGVKFISLTEALSDKAYTIDAATTRKSGYTFLNEIRVSRKLPNPLNVSNFYNSIPEDRLASICR